GALLLHPGQHLQGPGDGSGVLGHGLGHSLGDGRGNLGGGPVKLDWFVLPLRHGLTPPLLTKLPGPSSSSSDCTPTSPSGSTGTGGRAPAGARSRIPRRWLHRPPSR